MAADGTWSPDVLTRVVNVHWGGEGSVFVSGDQWGFGRYAKIETKTLAQNWTGLTHLDTASIAGVANGRINGSSYALAGGSKDVGRKGTPTFVLAGGVVRTSPADNHLVSHAIIMVSHDGNNWSTVFDHPTVLAEGFIGMTITDLVWDREANRGDGSFYARVFDEGVERTYESIDGIKWAPGGGSFTSHCNGKLPGQPDGVYGYDKENDILIEPSNDGVDITTGKGTRDETTVTVVLDFIGVFCVAFAGGIWVAGGNTVLEGSLNTACTASSIDDGKTWTMVSKGALGMHEETGQAPSIWTIVAAPADDLLSG